MSTAIMTVQDNWLTGSDTNHAVTTTFTTGSTLTYQPGWVQQIEYQYPYLTYPTIHISSPARPIKLTLREVDRLRTAAQKDEALRRILEKFTPQIEVAVSFDEP